MGLRLSETLPLRTTRMLGDFADDSPLPHRIGDLTASSFNLIRINDYKFFAADHPMEITTTLADNQETDGWARAVESDGLGNSYTVVNLSAPAPDNVVMSARGRGVRNPSTGALIENPGDVMEYVMRLAGRSDVFPQLRAESAAEGIALAGTIGSQSTTIRATLDLIARSAAAIWWAGGGRLYPTGTVLGPVIQMTKLDLSGFDVKALIDDTADVLRLSYDVSEATGQPQRYMEFTASPMRFGGAVVEMTLDWLRTPANAERIGTRVLSRMSGRRYRVTGSAGRTNIRPGAWVRSVGNPEWPTPDENPTIMVLGVDVAPDTRTTQLQAELVAEVPTITVTAHSVAIPPTAGAAIDLSISNGIGTFTIVDAINRNPIANARCQLDGGIAKTTDARGQVQFPITPGTHTLAVEAPGKVPFKISVLG